MSDEVESLELENQMLRSELHKAVSVINQVDKSLSGEGPVWPCSDIHSLVNTYARAHKEKALISIKLKELITSGMPKASGVYVGFTKNLDSNELTPHLLDYDYKSERWQMANTDVSFCAPIVQWIGPLPKAELDG